MAKGNY